MSFDKIHKDLLDIPASLSECLDYYLSDIGNDLLEKVRNIAFNKDIKRIIFVGHTYNYFASQVAFRYLNSRYNIQIPNRKACKIYEINEFLSFVNPKQFQNDSIFVIISESGDSPKVKKILRKLLEGGIKKEKIFSICNIKDSFLAENSGIFFPMVTGLEEIMGTKVYPNIILILYFIARAIIGKESIPKVRVEEIQSLIFEISLFIKDWENNVKSILDFIGNDYQYLYFISKGASLSTAFQAGLYCKSFTRTFGEGISQGLFLHGPFQIVDDSFRCFLITGDETNLDGILDLLKLITKRLGAGRVVLINNSRTLSELGKRIRNVLVIEHTTENTYLAPIYEIIIFQFLFLHQAKVGGIIQ